MQQSQPAITIRPVRLEDAEAIWQITREPGVIETILALPSARVELTVVVENERARRLYERLGFVIEGRRKMSVIAQGELKDEFLMARYR